MEARIDNSVVTHWEESLAPSGVNIDFGGVLDEFSTAKQSSLSKFVSCLERVGQTEGVGLSWEMGINYDFHRRGDIGALILSAGNLGSALNALVNYFPLIQDESALTMSVKGRWATLNYKILNPDIWPRHHDAVYTLGIYAALIKVVAPEAWPDVEFMFEAPARYYKHSLSQIVGAKCSFDCDSNLICFPSSFLEKKATFAPKPNRDLVKTLDKKLIMKNRELPFHVRVKSMIVQRLEWGDIRQEAIASALGVSGRTLNRRLVGEGYSFQKILDNCRMQLADLEFRRNNRISISQLALKLGYAEHSTFSRAFARWTGQSPHSYRSAIGHCADKNMAV